MLNGGKIVELRNKKGWTQADLAIKTGISPRQVCRIENHEGDTTTEMLLVLARTLGCNPIVLLDSDTNPTQPQPLEA